MEQTKECSQCQQIKSASEFYKAKKTSDGLQYECKDCHRSYNKPIHPRNLLIKERTCSQCEISNAAEKFYDNPYAKDGMDTFCRQCRMASNTKWNIEHPKERKQIANASAKKTRSNPEKRDIIYTKTRQWQINNPEKVKEHDARDREKAKKKPERMAKQKKRIQQWFKDHPTYKRSASHKRRALIKQAAVIDALIDIDILYARDHGICSLCGKKVRKTLKWPDLMCATIDHIVPLTRGGEHSWTNVALAHHRCNSLKNNRIVTQQLRLF
jgi:5-methylcytosine-specific restriction endonuclease McrA